MARFVDAFRSPRLFYMIGLGFAAGLPNPLTGSTTLGAWLASTDVSLAAIGAAALLQLPYNVKFLWAPLLDRYAPPRFGRRRGWMLITQSILLVAIVAMGLFDPARSPFAIGLMALAITFVSASQDIAVDAYRTDLLPPAERASGTALFVAAYRGALIVAGAGALVLSDHLAWGTVYAIMGALMVVGIVTTLFSPEPAGAPLRPRTLRDAIVDPMLDLLRRRRAWALLIIVALYKVGESVAAQMRIPFLGVRYLGFTNTEIGVVTKGIGLGATIVGALVGGGLVARFGLKRTLIWFGALQAAPNLLYGWLALRGPGTGAEWPHDSGIAGWLNDLHVSPRLFAMGTVITVDELMGGLSTAAFVALLMSLCDKRFTAMQYALLSGLGNVVGRLLASSSGGLATSLGWPGFFALTVVLGAPAIFLVAIVDLREEPAA